MKKEVLETLVSSSSDFEEKKKNREKRFMRLLVHAKKTGRNSSLVASSLDKIRDDHKERKKRRWKYFPSS